MNGNQNETRLEDDLRSVVQGQTELLDILRKNESKKKSKLEIAYEILRFIFVVIVPSIGVIFGFIFKNIQIKNTQVQTVEKFMPYLIADDEKAKSIALLAISALGNEELAVELGKIVKGTGSIFASSKIANSASTETIREYAKQSVEESLDLNINDTFETRVGSVFLGTPHGAFRVTEYGAIQFPPDRDIPITKLMEQRDGSVLLGTNTAVTEPYIGIPMTYLVEGVKVTTVPNIDDITNYQVGAEIVTVTIVPEIEIITK